MEDAWYDSLPFIGIFSLDAVWACVRSSLSLGALFVQFVFLQFKELVLWSSGRTDVEVAIEVVEVTFGWRVGCWKVESCGSVGLPWSGILVVRIFPLRSVTTWYYSLPLFLEASVVLGNVPCGLFLSSLAIWPIWISKFLIVVAWLWSMASFLLIYSFSKNSRDEEDDELGACWNLCWECYC